MCKKWYNCYNIEMNVDQSGGENMSDVAFENFTKQVLELSYEQTLTLMEKMLESLKTKRREKNYSEME